MAFSIYGSGVGDMNSERELKGEVLLKRKKEMEEIASRVLSLVIDEIPVSTNDSEILQRKKIEDSIKEVLNY